jgi:hypothetical protein
VQERELVWCQVVEERRHFPGGVTLEQFGGFLRAGPGLRRPVLLALRLARAGLLAATAAVHLDLYTTGYRSIPAIGGSGRQAGRGGAAGVGAAYWPPVWGPVTAGPGVTGKLGVIKRSDGSLEATCNGPHCRHPGSRPRASLHGMPV